MQVQKAVETLRLEGPARPLSASSRASTPNSLQGDPDRIPTTEALRLKVSTFSCTLHEELVVPVLR